MRRYICKPQIVSHHSRVGLLQTLKFFYLHNYQLNITNFEGPNFALGISVTKFSLIAGTPSSVTCDRLQCHKQSQHMILGTCVELHRS
jgi:hypothetical protein